MPDLDPRGTCALSVGCAMCVRFGCLCGRDMRECRGVGCCRDIVSNKLCSGPSEFQHCRCSASDLRRVLRVSHLLEAPPLRLAWLWLRVRVRLLLVAQDWERRARVRAQAMPLVRLQSRPWLHHLSCRIATVDSCLCFFATALATEAHSTKAPGWACSIRRPDCHLLSHSWSLQIEPSHCHWVPNIAADSCWN